MPGLRRAVDAQGHATGTGNRHGLGDRGERAGLDLGNAVQAAVGQARDGAERAGSHIDQELVPGHAHDVVADRGVQTGRAERAGNCRGARTEAAGGLADQSAFTAGTGFYIARRKLCAACISFACQYTLAAYDAGKNVYMPEAVLQRQHHGLWPQQAKGGMHRLGSVKGLDQHNQQVGWPAGWTDTCGRGHHTNADRAVNAVAAQHQTALAHGLDLGCVAVDQPDFMSGLGQHAANCAAQSAGT